MLKIRVSRKLFKKIYYKIFWSIENVGLQKFKALKDL